MKKTLLIILMIFSMQAFAQLYHGVKDRSAYYVEIIHDSAVVERFDQVPRGYFVYAFREVLVANSLGSDSLFVGSQFGIERKKESYFLSDSSKNGRSRIVKLDVCDFDNRAQRRKMAYLTYKQGQVWKLQDSLSGPDALIYLKENQSINFVYNDSISEMSYRNLVDMTSDSLTKAILLRRSPFVDSFYVKIDSVQYYDSTTIYNLLSKADYEFYYGRCLLERVVLYRPDYLIRYIDSNPVNKNKLLKGIRDHSRYEEIHQKVKVASPETKGKKIILNQKKKREVKDSLSNITAILALNLFIITEFAFVTLLIISGL